MENNFHNIIHNLEKYFLIGGLILLVVLLFLFLYPFLATILISAIIASAVHPLDKALHVKGKMPKTLSAIITMIIVIIVIHIIITFFSVSIIGQASDAYVTISDHIETLSTKEIHLIPTFERFPRVNEAIHNMLQYNPISVGDIANSVGNVVGTLTKFLVGQTTNIIKHVSLFVVHFLVFILSLFYFIRDGKDIVSYIKSLLPLPDKYRDELFNKMHVLMHSIIFGIFGAAIAQGLLLGIALAIVGVPNAAFWAAIGALLSPIPYVGISLVWIPIVITLFVSGSFGSGLFLLIWCMGVVATADNIVKPYLIGSSNALPPLLVLMVMLGGTFMFGFKALVFGPFILTLALAFLHIYSIEYKSVLKHKNK